MSMQEQVTPANASDARNPSLVTMSFSAAVADTFTSHRRVRVPAALACLNFFARLRQRRRKNHSGKQACDRARWARFRPFSFLNRCFTNKKGS